MSGDVLLLLAALCGWLAFLLLIEGAARFVVYLERRRDARRRNQARPRR